MFKKKRNNEFQLQTDLENMNEKKENLSKEIKIIKVKQKSEKLLK